MRQLCLCLCLVLVAASATAAPKRKGKARSKTPPATAPAEAPVSDAATGADPAATPTEPAAEPTASSPAPTPISATPLPPPSTENSAPAPTPAPPPAATAAKLSVSGGARFGELGVIVPGGDLALAFVRESGDSDAVVQLAPSVRYFVMENLAVGAGVGFGWTSASSSSVKYAFSPMVGYNVWLADGVSLFAELGIDFRKGTMAIGNAITDAQNDTGGSKYMDLTVAAPLLYHLGNYFVGGGPEIRIQLMGNDDFTPDDRLLQFGLVTTIGGWI